MPTIRVMIVEGHQQVRETLARVLETYNDIEIVNEAASGEEALMLCEHTVPDVVMTDLKPGIDDGVALTYAIKQRFPTVQVLVLTHYLEPYLVTQVLQAGALGYLLKDATGQELHQAIQSVNAGREVLAPEVEIVRDSLS